MVDKIQDLNLPAANVARLIKEALPDGINIGKEARSAISKAATGFIVYLTSSTATAAKKQKHKSLSSDNVFSALEEIEFENFIEPLRDALEAYRKITKDKKLSKINDNKIEETSNANDNTVDPNEDMNGATV